MAEGVTQERAIELTSQTPLACDLVSCVQEALDPRTKTINSAILEMQLANVVFARGLGRSGDANSRGQQSLPDDHPKRSFP